CSSMSSDLVISCDRVGKAFQLYMRRNDQLKQAIFGHWKQFYHQHWVLRDVSLKVRRGETIGIVGRNGAGKTTLLQIICGITLPTLGRVQVNGRVAPILALGAGFDHELTGRENALIGGAILGMRRAAVEARLPEIAAFAEIGDFFYQPLKLYSSGMSARLAFAVCAHADADILIVDEALSVGDAAFGTKCDAFIKDFANRGTILVVSHDLETLQEICDRVIWIEDGGVQAMGAAKDVIARYREAMDGRPVPALAASF
ncbi:MAG: ABC transporter ATP-binding protein, partial [Methylocella sp.]